MSSRYLIDANILFSAFISGKELYTLLFSEHAIYLPDFAFLELEKYKERILKKTKLKEEEFQEFVLKLFSNVTVIPNLLLSHSILKQAHELCKDIDEKDTVYVAAALEFDLILLTNDQRLYLGLRERNFSKVALWSDIADALPRMP